MCHKAEDRVGYIAAKRRLKKGATETVKFTRRTIENLESEHILNRGYITENYGTLYLLQACDECLSALITGD